MTTTPAMPELPEHAFMHRVHNLNSVYDIKCYTGSQMNSRYTQGYNDALATLQAQPAAAGMSDAEIDRICYLATEIRFAKTDDAAQAVIDKIRAILALRPQAVPMTCTWEQEDECGSAYSTTCGNTFMFEDGGPSDNGAKFCCYCGGRLSEQKWVEPADDGGITAPAGGEG